MRKLIIMLALAVTLTACGQRPGAEAAGETLPPPTTTTATTTTSTTTSTTTTTTTIVEVVPSFLWGGGFAEIGVLAEPTEPSENAPAGVVLAGRLIRVYRSFIQMSEGLVPTWSGEMYFGTNPETGEEIFADLIIGFEIENWIQPFKNNDSGRSVLEGDLGNMGEFEPLNLTIRELVNMLEVGRLYPVVIPVSVPNVAICRDTEYMGKYPAVRVWCEKETELSEPDGPFNVIAYNTQLYQALLGVMDSPKSEFGYGTIDPIPVWNGPDG